MSQLSSVSPVWLAVMLAPLPSFASWWWYRTLLRGGDAAVLPERLAAVRQRVSIVTGVATALTVLASGRHALWAAPLMLAMLACTDHPTRKQLFGETWPLGRFIAWQVRVIIAIFGFWLLLAAAPPLVAAQPATTRWWAAGMLAVTLLAWLRWYGRVLVRVLGASPLERLDLDPLVEQVLARTTAARPTLWRAGAQGGVLANALALPGLAGNGVLFFDTLLERLTPREIAAIFAHEVAHLEYFNAARLRRAFFVTSAAIVLVLAGTAAFSGSDAVRPLPTAFWPVCVFIAMAVRASRMQAHETASDLRAIELCGDPEALVSALTLLHTIHHVPRRWSAHAEQHATHPSLARRIRAIRARSNASEQRLERLVAVSSDAGRFAIFDHDRLSFLWTDADIHAVMDDPTRTAKRLEAITYDQLTELRLKTAPDGTVTLTGRGTAGARWIMPLQPGEAARVQAALDTVDQLLATPQPIRTTDVWRRAGALNALVMAASLRSFFPIAAPALLALSRPTRAMLSALAAALVTTAFLTPGDSTVGAIRAGVLSILAGVAIWQARGARTSTQSSTEALGLALPALAGAAIVIADGNVELFDLHTSARDAVWIAASLVALFAYLAASLEGVRRPLTLGVAALAAATLWVGSSPFLTHVVRDPLVAATPVLSERTASLTPIARASVDGEFTGIQLTSDGRHFLLTEEDEYEEDHGSSSRHALGGFDGWSRSIDVVDAVFVDDTRLLTMVRWEDGVRLQAETLREASAGWTLGISGIDSPSLDSAAARWQLIDRHGDRVVRVEGNVGARDIARTSWDIEAGSEHYVAIDRIGPGNVGLGVAIDWNSPRLSWFTSDWRRKTTLLRIDPHHTTRIATSRLDVACARPGFDVSTHACVAFDGRTSRFWQFDALSGRLLPTGQLPGQFRVDSHEPGIGLTGRRGWKPALVRVDEGSITAFNLAEAARVVDDFDIAGQFLASLQSQGNESVVMLYRLSFDDRAPGTDPAAARVAVSTP